MSQDGEYREVTTAEELRELIGQPMVRAALKDRVRLHDVHKQWLAASPLCFVATSAPDGSCDVSPKGDPPGFALVLDDATIALPERPGNRRVDGFHNILGNPHVGLVFIIPGRQDTLRINGRARIVREAPFFEQMIVDGHRPKLALVVDIEQIFFHCPKAFMRAKVWKPESWKPEGVPAHHEISFALQPEGTTKEALAEYYGPTYVEKLYKDGTADPPAPKK